MKRLFAAVGTFGLAIGVAVGGPPASPLAAKSAPTPEPAVLVVQLGSDEYHEREAAVTSLEKIGPAALPALREGAKSSDPEVRQRASIILVKLQRAADSSSRLVPKKVTLTYSDLSLGTAFNDLKARTGLNITLDPARIEDPLRKVTCVTGEVPVWEALEAFCTAAGLREAFVCELDVPKKEVTGRRAYVPPAQVPNPDAVPIVLVDGKGASVPGSRNSAVRVLALPRNFPGHRVTLGTGEITLCFDVTPSPGLNWQEVVDVKITKLIDDAGRPGSGAPAKSAPHSFNDMDGIVAGWGGPGVRFGGFGGGRFDPRTGAPIYPDTMPNPRVVPVPLKIASPDARKLKRLEGVVVGEILLTNQPIITVTDPEKHAGSTFDGPGQVRLNMVAVTAPKDGNGASVQVNLEFPSPWSIGARRGWNPGGIWPEAPRNGNQMPTVQVFDAAGKAMVPLRSAQIGFGGAFPNDDGITMHQGYTLNFPKDSGAPAKIVVTGPRPMIVEVPFAMENVPLP